MFVYWILIFLVIMSTTSELATRHGLAGVLLASLTASKSCVFKEAEVKWRNEDCKDVYVVWHVSSVWISTCTVSLDPGRKSQVVFGKCWGVLLLGDRETVDRHQIERGSGNYFELRWWVAVNVINILLWPSSGHMMPHTLHIERPWPNIFPPE